jgi:hypothetical protein
LNIIETLFMILKMSIMSRKRGCNMGKLQSCYCADYYPSNVAEYKLHEKL